MSGRHHHRGNRGRSSNSNHTLSSVARETATSLPADSPVLAIFKAAALKLNDRQDRHERLVKLSRDITIESKRIIFLLHSAITKESLDKTLKEADDRIQKLISGPIKSIGLELENSPAYLHSRAVTAGFQEFIEARTLYSLMATKEIIPYTEVQKEFSYSVKNEQEEERSIVTMIPETDYMLGLADLTGELMRKAINSISSGDSDECFHACQVVRDLYTGYLGITGTRLIGKKLNVTRANVFKVEMAVYALRVRGGEAPPTLLLPAAPAEWEASGTTNFSDDEGYY
ncbi:translin associated factor X [Anticarsia gemmatalis]|uniref:translin associated factor X n=1 Tax=Anticarsia gemmatalis TaxID=129554 RepID=UPI003F7627B6